MLALFRYNQFLFNILLLLYVVLLQHSLFFGDLTFLESSAGPLAEPLFQIASKYALGTKIFIVLLLFFQAVYINRIVGVNRLSGINSMFPGLFYVLLMSLAPIQKSIYVQLIANTFLIFALYDLMLIVRRNQRSKLLFNAMFWISVASLFDVYYLIFTLLPIIAINIQSSLKNRDLLVMVFAFLMPFYFAWALNYIFEVLPEANLLSYFKVSDFDFSTFNHSFLIGTLVILLLITVFSFINMDNLARRVDVFGKRKLRVIAASTFLAMVFFVIHPAINFTLFAPMFIGIGILFGLLMLGMENKLIPEIIHIFLLIFVFFFQYYRF